MSRRPVRLPATAGDRAVRLALAAGVLLALAGCSLDQWTPRTYEPPLQQGNVIDPEAVARLKPGMTRSQVRFVLGTPMVVDVFRNDRWDYVYLHRRQGEPTRQRRLAVFFDGDLLARIETDGVAGAPGAGAAPAAAAGGVGAARAAPASPTPPPGAGAAAGSPASRGAVAPAGGPGSAAPAGSAAAGSGAPGVTGAAGAPATAPGSTRVGGAPAAAPGATGAGGAAVAAPPGGPGSAGRAPGEPPATEAGPAPARGFFGRMLERIGL
jgi:outer membrane protein assembly factor BamE